MNIKIDTNTFVTIGGSPPSKKEAVTSVPTHRIIIYDRSGSMYSVLKDVVSDICTIVASFPPEDLVSIGWFSTEGQFRFMCKGLPLTNKQGIVDTVRKNANIIGLTCFSEISADAVTVAEEIKSFNPTMPAALTFLTDGNPVVSNYTREIANLKAALTRLGTVIETAVFIGYGSWYNRETLSSMAWWAGGTFVHAASLSDIRKVYSKYHVEMQAEKRFPYEIIKAKGIIAIYALNKGSVSIFDPSEKSILIPEGAIVGIVHEDPNIPQARDAWSQTTVENALYAGALAASQGARSDVAMAILGTLGDKGLAQLVSNCITQDEVGQAEKKLSLAVEGKERYANGKEVGCVPSDNAVCVFDILETLVNGDTKFYPYHSDFKYKRTGIKTKASEGYAKFIPDTKVPCSISSLVFHTKRLNASIQVTIPGTIDLGEGAEKVGLARIFTTKQIRTYTVIKDGRLNVEALPVTGLDRRVWNSLAVMGVIGHPWTSVNDTITISLADFPVMNRAMGRKYLSTKLLGNLASRELGLEAQVKAIKDALLIYDTVPEPTPFQTAEQIKFLLDSGISEKGIYSPPTEVEESSDVYEARGVEVVIKGLSSLPSVNEVKKKISSGKSLTRGERIISDAMGWLDGLTQPVNDRLKFLQRMDGEAKRELRQVRYDMAKTRAAVILGGRWFTELGSRANTVFKYNDFDYGDLEIELKDRLERVSY